MENGFPEKIIHFGLPESAPDADLYFCDGLDGRCLEVLPRLPKEKSFLLSGDEDVRKKVMSKGFNVIISYKELEKVVESRKVVE